MTSTTVNNNNTQVKKSKNKVVRNGSFDSNNKNQNSLFDETIDQTNVTTDQLNIAIYKSDYKSFRSKLLKDVDKYHKLEVWYGKLISFMGTLTWSTSVISFLLTGIDSIMSSIISTNSNYLTQ